MIIRQDGDHLLFITQPDHARLAAEVMSAWRADGLPDHPRREAILSAVREHDNGWIEEDTETHVDGAGNPLDFVAVPPAVKHRIWPRAIGRLGERRPYEAALVAQHALTIHGQQRSEAVWSPFFRHVERLREEMLARCDVDARTTLETDYRFVQAGDQLSLVFCNGWRTPFPRSGGRILLQGSTLELSPDPFDGARVPLRVRARRVLARSYASAADLRASLDTARLVMIEGEAAGPSH
jgi:hypothetical protein